LGTRLAIVRLGKTQKPSNKEVSMLSRLNSFGLLTLIVVALLLLTCVTGSVVYAGGGGQWPPPPPEEPLPSGSNGGDGSSIINAIAIILQLIL